MNRQTTPQDPVMSTPTVAGAGPGATAVSLLLALALSVPADAQQGERLPLTLENIFKEAASVSDAAVSPEGQSLAVVVREGTGSQIRLVDLGGEQPRGERWVEGRSPVWSPDGTGIAFVRGGQLWITRRQQKAALQLTDDMEGLRAPVFSPDGTRVAFYATDSGNQDIWVVPADGDGDPERLTSGAMPEGYTRYGPAWSPDGSRIAYVSNAADYWADDVWIVDVGSGESRQLSTSIMARSTPAWSPDGDEIVLPATGKDEFWYHDLAHLYRLDPSTGEETQIETQVLAADDRPIWSPDGETIYFLRLQKSDYDLWAVPRDGGVATQVTNVGGDVSSVTMDGAGEVLTFVRSGLSEPPEAHAVDTKGGPARAVTDLSSEWADLQQPREIFYRSYDGLYMQAFLYRPPEAGDGATCPALVQVHGGGTNTYEKGLNLIEHYMASQGYVVMAINYRGGSGFGREFQDLGGQDWLDAQGRDPGAAADYLRSLEIVNGDVGIYGGSYGGMMSMAGIIRTPEKFDAAVPTRGIYAAAQTFDLMDRVGKQFTKTGHGGTPEEKPDAYAESNMINKMDRIQAPLLIMHGEADPRAPFRNYELAVERLEELGKQFEARSYPGEPHGFRDPDNNIDLYDRTRSFFDRHLESCGPR